MATLNYPSLTSRQTQQTSTSGPLTTTLQNSQGSTVARQSQASSSGAQLSTTQNTNNQSSPSPARSTNYHIPNSNLPASRITSQSVTSNRTLPPPHKESPGAWKHPRAEEIARRQKASTFGADNISLLFKTFAALISVEMIRRFLYDITY